MPGPIGIEGPDVSSLQFRTTYLLHNTCFMLYILVVPEQGKKGVDGPVGADGGKGPIGPEGPKVSA